MSNHTWVCFECRTAARRPGRSTAVRCPACGKACEDLGWKVAIPPREREREWERMRARFLRVARETEEARRETGARWVRHLEGEIERLGALPANAGRSAAVRALKKRLAAARSAQSSNAPSKTR